MVELRAHRRDSGSYCKPCARFCGFSGRLRGSLRSDDCGWRLPMLRAAPCWRPQRSRNVSQREELPVSAAQG